MGQNPSVSVSTYRGDSDLAQVQTRLQAQLAILRSLARVSHREVLSCIEELNSVTRTFTDRSGKQLRFMVRKGTDTTFLWKATIRIACIKVNTNSSSVESSRLLTLRQFVMIYREITEQVAALSGPIQGLDRANAQSQEAEQGHDTPTCKVDEFTASAFFPSDSCEKTKGDDADAEKKGVGSGLADALTECCVCMDRKACVMLSCCHEFCEICIDNWTRDERHSTCPLCRTKVEGNDDAWVLTDEQDPRDYESEVRGYLVGLADRSGRPAEQQQQQQRQEQPQSSVDGDDVGGGDRNDDSSASDDYTDSSYDRGAN